MVLQGRKISIGHHIDGSTLDISDMPPFSQQRPLINDEHEEDDVHANRIDHDKGLWENIPT